MKSTSYKKGHFIGLGLAIGIPIGIPIGLLIGILALGPAIGAAIGLLLGVILEQRYNKKPIELSREERKKRTVVWGVLVVIGLLSLVTIIILNGKV